MIRFNSHTNSGHRMTGNGNEFLPLTERFHNKACDSDYENFKKWGTYRLVEAFLSINPQINTVEMKRYSN